MTHEHGLRNSLVLSDAQLWLSHDVYLVTSYTIPEDILIPVPCP